MSGISSVFARSALPALLLLGACRAPVAPARVRPASPAEHVAVLERAAQATGTAASYGRAALAAWVVTGEGRRALGLAQKALEKDPAEAAALLTRALAAREAADEAGAAQAALALVTGAPQSPLAEVAAARLSATGQKSPAIDRALEQGLAGLATGNLGLPGRAALRAREALLSVAEGRNDDEAAARVRAAMGMPTRWTLVGPLGTSRLTGVDAPSPLDDPKAALLKGYPPPWTAPAELIAPRAWPAPTGTVDVSEEPWRADVFEALADLDVKKGGVHLVSLRGASPAILRVDGVEVARRSPLPARAPERTLAAVDLPAGRHRVRVRFGRAEGANFTLQLARADGTPAEIESSSPAVGAAPPQGGARAAPLPGGTAEAMEQALAADPDDAGAAWVRTLALAADHVEAARAELDRAQAACGESPALRLLRADLAASDPDLAGAVATARVARDVDAVLADHPEYVRAQLVRFEQERAEKRWDDAQERLSRLADAGAGRPWLEMSAARLALDRGDRAGAKRRLERALELDPGRCEALSARADLARRDDETQVAAKLVPQLAGCPGTQGALVAWYRERGNLKDAETLAEKIVARAPTAIWPRTTLSEIRNAQGDGRGAAAAMEPLVAMWPERIDALRRLAYLQELSGQFKSALELRKRALQVDGSDLSLARAVALDQGGDALDWAARDGLQAIEAWRRSGKTWHAPAVQVLDLGAWELQPDGSTLERIHSVVQVLDKKGIDRYGEVDLPEDAQALVVRTVKADGRVLEAESIAGKQSVSLPDLEPGDFAEYEYLRAVPARAAALPGWQSGPFYFRAPDVPFFESRFEVRVPAAMGLELEVRNLEGAAAPRREGEWLIFSHVASASEPYVREPLAPPDAEVLPWLEAGAGARQDDVVRQIADWLPLRLRGSDEVRRFVRGTAQLPEAERIRTIVARVREAVRGDSSPADFSQSPGAVLARGRGNRLSALKAALEAAGVRSHLVLARPFSAPRGPLRFPRPDYYSSPVLRIEPSAGEPLWMDFTLRQAPLGLLPEELSGAEAVVVPAPGEPVRTLTLPEVDPARDRTDAEFDLALDSEGTLHGVMTQTATGFDAAAVRRRLEQLNETDIRKQQERMLGATFRGVALEAVSVDDPGDPDRPVVVRTTFRAPRFARRPDGSLAFPANFGAQSLGPRFVSRAERKTPLLVAGSYVTRARARLKLPPGLDARVPESVELSSDFGTFRARWAKDGAVLSLEEEVSVRRARIEPARYGAFVSFAAAVDAAQSRDVPLVPAGGSAPSAGSGGGARALH